MQFHQSAENSSVAHLIFSMYFSTPKDRSRNEKFLLPNLLFNYPWVVREAVGMEGERSELLSIMETWSSKWRILTKLSWKSISKREWKIGALPGLREKKISILSDGVTCQVEKRNWDPFLFLHTSRTTLLKIIGDGSWRRGQYILKFSKCLDNTFMHVV